MARIIIILFFIVYAEFLFGQYPDIPFIPLQQEFCDTQNRYITNDDLYENYWQNEELTLWERGLILNDSLLYLQKVANRFSNGLKRTLTTQNFKIFLLKSTKPEVFSFPNGNIYLSVGWVLNLKNEQELMFLISKEIAKNILSSNENIFFEKDSIEKRIGKYTGLNYQERLITLKKLEKDFSLLEDSLAISLLKIQNLFYSKQIREFLLRCPYPNLPTNDESLNFSIFDSRSYQISNKFKSYTSQKNFIDNNYNDDFLESYNSEKRINYLKEFLSSSEEINKQQICENCFNALRNEVYSLNISLLMDQKKFKEALYFLMTDKNLSQKSKIKIGVCIHNIAVEKRVINVNDAFNLNGMKKINFWLKNSSPYEVAIINLNYQFLLLSQNPNSTECNYLFTNSLNELTKFYSDSIRINNIPFYKYNNLEENIDLLKKNAETVSISPENPKAIFYDLLQEELFFEKISTFLIDWKSRRLSYKPMQKIELGLKIEELNFDGKTNYSIVNLNYLGSGFNYEVLSNFSCKNYNILKSTIDIDSFRVKNNFYSSQTTDTSKVGVNAWQSQIYWVNDFYNKNYVNPNSGFISYPISQLENANKWQTKYLLYVTNQTIEVEKSKFQIAVAGVGSLVSIFWPLTVPYLIKKQSRSKYSFCLYDVWSQKLVYKNEVSIEKKITQDILKQTFYQDLKNIQEKL